MGRGRAVVASYVGVGVVASVVFLGAGRLWFWPGLLYLALAWVGTTANHLLVPPGSDLTERRAAAATQGEAWDRRLLGLHFLTTLVTFAVAGADAGRFGWSGPVPPAVYAVGAVAMVAGQLLFAWAKRENAFFSSTVHLQQGHQVCDRGPYRWVRHPGYLGLAVAALAFPLVLGSWWAFAPAAVGLGLLTARTAREDRFLHEQLPGYRAYAARVRWRLLPGLF